MGSGPWRPGQPPARGFHPIERPKAYVPDTPPPETSGAQPRRGYDASRHPSKRFRFPKRPKAYEVYGGGAGAIAGYGPSGAATFVLSLEGAKLTLAWSTDIFRSYSGNEQRSSPFERPRQRIEGPAFLLDASSRDVRGALQRAAAAGSTFLLAVPYEETFIASDTTNATIAVLDVGSTAGLDWALPQQRVIIIGVDGTIAYAVIQSVTSTAISVAMASASGSLTFSPIGSVGKTGGRVMPLVPVLLDPQQGFTRYPVSVELWSIHVTVTGPFGWVGTDSMGLGAKIYTYTQGGPTALSKITDADLLVWDRPNLIDGTADEAMLSGAETLDLGALPTGFGDQTVPDWSRPIRYVSSDPAEWQWLKAFLRLCRGRQRPFLLSTNRDDLIFAGTIAGGIKVQSSSVAGGGDYSSWYASLAHRRLAITEASGAITYATVTAAPTNNGDGTLSLVLDNSPTGTPARISIAEQLRIDNEDSDDIEIMWDGGTFAVDLIARAVQETIVPPLAFLFEAYKSLSLAYVPPVTPPADQELGVGFSDNTQLVYFASDRTLGFGGIVTTVAPFDGMVVAAVTVNPNAFAMSWAHEDTTWPAQQRVRLPNNTGLSSVAGAYWFVFCAAVQRWILLATS